jgi:hypothetical protein
MSKRAVVHKSPEMEPASEEEMVKRRRLAEELREQMKRPVTKEDLEIWKEFKASIERRR